MSWIKIITNWLTVAAWLALIFWLSAQPNLKTDLGYDWWLRKAAHMVEFGILYLLLFRALRGHELTNKKALLWAILLSALYAATDEYHQTLVFGRYGNLKDWGIDVLGITLTAIWLTRRFIKKPATSSG